MRRDSLKLLLLAGMVAFAILYGMELSSGGIAKVYGPLDQQDTGISNPATADEGDWTLPPLKKSRTMPGEHTAVVIPRDDRTPIVDRISGTAAETLHHISTGGIRFVVSLFDRMTGS